MGKLAIRDLYDIWLECILDMPISWQNTLDFAAPKEFCERHSTTNACKQANLSTEIINLSEAKLAPFHMEKNLNPTNSRNILMLRNNKPWIFAASWIEAQDSSEILEAYNNLGDNSLGSILFNGAWSRGEFKFAEVLKYLCRASYFTAKSTGEQVYLIEMFFKDTDDAEYCYEQTKLKMAHE